MDAKDSITVSSFPQPIPENPYQAQLYEHLGKIGVKSYPEKIFLFDELIRRRREVDIIHFHWLFDQVYTPRKLIKFLARLIEAKLLGYRIVWTVHNLKSHEEGTTGDWFARFILSRISSAIIVHGDYVRREVEARFKVTDKVHVIPHGNYIGVYPNTIEKDQARQRLGIPDNDFVYLFFGLVRKYKGLEGLMASFKELRDDSTLMIVGKPSDEKIKEKMEGLAKDNEKIRLFLEYVPDDDVQLYMNSADVVVLPFKQITTSGSLILALSYGKPVISVNKGVIPEIVGDGMGILIDDNTELSDALKRIRKENFEDMGSRGLEKVKEYGWDKVAQAHRSVYELALHGRR